MRIDSYQRNFVREGLEDARDGLVYVAAAMLRAQRERARVSAAVESLAGLVRPVRESPADDTAQMSACDDPACDYHQGRPAARPDAWDLPDGQTQSEPIRLGPRSYHSKSESKRVEALAAPRELEKYGRDQRRPERRYRTTPGGRVVPLCKIMDCPNAVRSRGRCRRHGG